MSAELAYTISGTGSIPDPMRLKGRHHVPFYWVPVTILVLLFLAYYAFYVQVTISRISAYQLLHERQLQEIMQLQKAHDDDRKTLVLYIFAPADPEYITNLEYFVQWGITESDSIEYIIVLQDDQLAAGTASSMYTLNGLQLPLLPSNARYIKHKNECYDWGTFGWLLLRSGEVSTHKYKYFIFLNSSVRGPFMPAYLRHTMHWTEAFTNSINEEVKLVGPTISCVGVPFAANQSNEWRKVAHVQSYAMATDQLGLQVLIRDGKVFKCHAGRWDAIWYSELGSSLAVLNAGYNIGSFLVRYDNIDFRNNGTWKCNDGMASAGVDNLYDGITAGPMEAMFVKVKEFLIRDGASAAQAAIKYRQWQHDVAAPAARNITSNAYRGKLRSYLMTKVMEMAALGQACFDMPYYKRENAGLVPSEDDKAWRHFMTEGQFMANIKFQFQCNNASETIKNLTQTVNNLVKRFSPKPPSAAVAGAVQPQ